MFSQGGPSEVGGKVDVCIVGAGPAGMTAAVYAARKALSVAVIAKDIGGQVAWTQGIENYMGFQFITGKELVAKFEEQVRQFPVAVVIDEVVGIQVKGKDFVLSTKGGRVIEARSVIVATGKHPKPLGVHDEGRLVGKGVSYCATCDGPFFKGMDVAVIGGGNSAVQAAVEMSRIARKVYIVSRSPWKADGLVADSASKATNIERRTRYSVVSIIGDNKVEGLRIKEMTTRDVEELKVQGVFLEIGLEPNSGFARGLLALTGYGEVMVDCECRTNIKGVFAAGDVTNAREKQIVIAAGDGAKAALSAYEYLTAL